MMMLIDDTDDPKINHIQEKDANKLEIMIQATSNFTEGNQLTISIHKILCETYHKLLNLDCEYTLTYNTENCNIINERLPIISYGKNLIGRDNINFFFKKFTNIDKEFQEISTEKIILQAEILEKLILTDLQLYLGVFLYHQNTKQTPVWLKLLKAIYNPCKTFLTYREDNRVLLELKENLVITELGGEIKNFIAINHSIENFLNEVGGKKYCDNLLNKKRAINSIDLLIYSAYKAEMRAFNGSEVKDNLNLQLAKYLSDNIDLLINENKNVKNEICLVDKKTLIAPKPVPKYSKIFRDYPQIIEKMFNFKKEFVRRLFIFGSFFAFILALKIKN